MQSIDWCNRVGIDSENVMADDALYTLEKLSCAARELAVGVAPLPQRLRDAWREMHSASGSIPWEDIRDRFRDIGDYFNFDQAADRYAFETLGKDDQQRIAGEIFDLFVSVDRRCKS
jgi:hypothetical protein